MARDQSTLPCLSNQMLSSRILCGSKLSRTSSGNHCRSDPVQVQSTNLPTLMHQPEEKVSRCGVCSLTLRAVHRSEAESCQDAFIKAARALSTKVDSEQKHWFSSRKRGQFEIFIATARATLAMKQRKIAFLSKRYCQTKKRNSIFCAPIASTQTQAISSSGVRRYALQKSAAEFVSSRFGQLPAHSSYGLLGPESPTKIR